MFTIFKTAFRRTAPSHPHEGPRAIAVFKMEFYWAPKPKEKLPFFGRMHWPCGDSFFYFGRLQVIFNIFGISPASAHATFQQETAA